MQRTWNCFWCMNSMRAIKLCHGLRSAEAESFSVETTTPTASSVLDRRFAFQRPATKSTACPKAAERWHVQHD
jgi:hypothetical protein